MPIATTDFLAEIADRLQITTPAGPDTFRAPCPHCDGERMPLYVKVHDSGERLWVDCHCGGRDCVEQALADADMTWDDLIPVDEEDPATDAVAYARDRFGITDEDFGLLGLSDRHERLWVPLRDVEGTEIGRQGRDYTGESSVKWQSPAGQRVPGGFLPLRPGRPVVIVEGPGDGLVAWKAGYNALVVLGAGRATDPRVVEMARAVGTRVITAFDCDEKGRAATATLSEFPAAAFPAEWGTRGRNDLTDLLQDRGPDAVTDALDRATRPRPRLCGTGQRAIVDLATLAVERHLDLGLYRQGGTIMSLIRTAEQGNHRAELKPVTAARLAALVAERVDVYRPVPSKDDEGVTEAPLETVTDTVAGRALVTDTILGIPAVRAVLSRPVLMPDGSILSTEGYDAAEEVIFAPARPMGDLPTVEEAVTYLRDLTRDFPFATEADRGRLLGALLMPAVRAYVAGGLGHGLAMPGVVITASTPGTGKSYLATLLQAPYCAPGTGRDVAAGKGGDEVRKWVSTKLLGSDAVIVVDNVRTGASFGGPEIDTLLTAPVWSDRSLGSNTEIRALNDRLWVWSGNNIAPEGDTADRIVHVRLDLDTANPGGRDVSSFAVGDLEAHLNDQGNRDRLLMAVLALAQGWHAAGAVAGEGTWRSYTGLVRTVDGILQWAGLGRFLATEGRIDTDEADGDADWEALYAAMYATGKGWSATELAELTRRPGDPLGVAAAHVMRPANGNDVTRAYAAKVLGGRRDTVIGRLKLVKWPDRNRNIRNWAVVDAATRELGAPVAVTEQGPEPF